MTHIQPQEEQTKEEKAKRKYTSLLRKEEEESVKFLSKKYGIPYVDISTFPIETDVIKLISEDQSREGEVTVFQATGKRIKVGVRNPDNDYTKAVLNKLKEHGFIVALFLVSRRSLQHAWDTYQRVPEEHVTSAGSIQVSNEKIDIIRKEIKTVADIKARMEKAFVGRTTDAIEIIVAGALAVDASDIHIEPQAERVRLRYRLDGALQDVTFMSHPLYRLLLSRIKLISGLLLNIRERAQDGRFTIKTGNVDMEVRVSALPGPNGENIVCRILNPAGLLVKFEDLGMQPWVSDIIVKELQRPNGMILTTGPTGSGKTTALYTFLKCVHTPDTKIITLEDPIEYHLEGIEQTQVDSDKGYDFANGLRAIVRQDPDIILVGEIRDLETANTALNSALTGHLVFSTLHTNNAAGAIPRLINLGVKKVIIAPAINVAMGQRLVRRLCPVCRQPHELTAEEKATVENELKKFPKNIPTPPSSSWTFFKATHKEDCERCNGIGYKGRIGVFEIILIDETMEPLIMGDPSELQMKKAAFDQGQLSMQQDGLLKILVGITDFQEVIETVGTFQ